MPAVSRSRAPRLPHVPSAAGPPERAVAAPELAELRETTVDWYRTAARDLPWRRPDCSPWGSW
ncbi:hypothetical protein GCM10025865_06270 [Paraoerskovia sediminicola]|uniref:A/G-specific adenine glycosylase n=1 Tax=Paraoerskovia sediminicola TaxID=1138587 RepID=A0ABM8G007_9CELL|nr:hypothetical protein GCM10025865_06270 [Paraoerskovia sediminicola]